MVPTCRALGVLRQQRAVAAAAAAAAVAAAWVGQAPGGPGLSLQPGPTLSLLKCAEASTIAPGVHRFFCKHPGSSPHSACTLPSLI